MPIVVAEKDIPWEESEDGLVISLPLNGTKAAKADIYSNDLFIKVFSLTLCVCSVVKGLC